MQTFIPVTLIAVITGFIIINIAVHRVLFILYNPINKIHERLNEIEFLLQEKFLFKEDEFEEEHEDETVTELDEDEDANAEEDDEDETVTELDEDYEETETELELEVQEFVYKGKTYLYDLSGNVYLPNAPHHWVGNWDFNERRMEFERLQIVNYSPKSFAVIGDTKLFKDKLKELGGRFNRNLVIKDTIIPGWIFSEKHSLAVQKFVKIHL